ncbi:bifunctional folylpolyglutamate synthase/dihydrofolate synthase [Ferruginibacter sp. SUN002]|uniref:bifunctional folylpolyglutamate synthase/dihydrofolate synthase n=1 Tax=Ferruginibacter sp. SUN002 TaxID=2937789 RepID=UPI003D36F946
MTYQQTIDYLYAQLPMFSRIGSIAYKADLHNTIELCSSLDDPHTKFKSIHIAGTNGKGSTSHMLAAILQKAGYKTGLYTSPHLKDFRERIKINGEMITEDFVIDFVEKTKTLSDKISPSFFELTVAMAFDYFAEEKVDIAVIETGLGGRLDSTNIITPILSIITNIGYDHMNILGDTLDKIAFEKAGIIKPNIPVIIGEYLPETKPIFINKAAECKAAVSFAEEQFSIYDLGSTIYDLSVTVESAETKKRELLKLDLNGLYQSKNLRTVLSAVNILNEQGFIISDEHKKYALANTKKLTGLHGRWDVISSDPIVVLDVAHNEDGIKQVLEQVRRRTTDDGQSTIDHGPWTMNHEQPKPQLHFIIGMVKDKEVSKVLSLLPSEARYYFTNSHIPRALPASELQLKAKEFGLIGETFDNVNDAIDAAKRSAQKDDLIIVCGSVFLVGEVNY